METSGPTKTEFRVLASLDALELRALEVFDWDLRSISEYLDVALIEPDQAEASAKEMMWDAVAVRYWRAFKMNPRNHLMSCIEHLTEPRRVYHDHLVEMRHKLFAHHAGLGSMCEVTVVSEVDSMDRGRVTAVACHQSRVSQLGFDQAVQLQELLTELQPLVHSAIERLRACMYREWVGASRMRVKELKRFDPETVSSAAAGQVIPAASRN